MPGTLTPGSTPNWTATTVPAQQGNAAHVGYNAEPICLWTATSVNFDTYSTARRIGVFAVHACGPQNGNCGIEKVRFIANDGTPLDVSAPTLNPQSGYWEFWCDVATLGTDGIVEIRAIVYPSSGQPFVMQGGYLTSLSASAAVLPTADQSLLLWSNAGGTYDGIELWVDAANTGGDGTELDPFTTLDDAIYHVHYTLSEPTDNLTIWMKAGTYEMQAASGGDTYGTSRWIHFRAAPGVAREDVIIAGRSGDENRCKLMHCVDVSVPRYVADSGAAFYSGNVNYTCNVWFEGVLMPSDFILQTSPVANGAVTAGATIARYMSKSAANRNTVTDGRGTAMFLQSQDLDIDGISGDIANPCRLYRGFTIINAAPSDGDHMDFIQTGSVFPAGNCAWADGKITLASDINGLIFNDRKRHRIGFVNLVLSCPTGAGTSYAFGGDGCVFWHLTMPDQRLFILTDPYDIQGDTDGGMEDGQVSIENCIVSLGYQTKTNEANPVGITYEEYDADNANRINSNHLLPGSSNYGTNSTSGTLPTYRAQLTGDFYAADAPLKTKFLPWDLSQRTRQATTPAGAYELEFGFPPLLPRTGKIFGSGQTITIAPIADGDCYFTVDGTTPDASKTLYTDPITLSASFTLKARYISTDDETGEISEAAYFVITDGTPPPPSIS